MIAKKSIASPFEELIWKWLGIIIGVGLIHELQRWDIFKTFNLELTAAWLFLGTLILCFWPRPKKSYTTVAILLLLFLLFLITYSYGYLPYPSERYNFAALALIYLPLFFLIFSFKPEINFFESDLKSVTNSLVVFILAALVVFPLMVLLNHYFQNWVFHRHYHGGDWTQVNWTHLKEVFFKHFFFIALPEEFFFRGYLQEKFNNLWGRPVNFLGARVGHGLWVTALIFALSHSLIALQWWHFAIFFPGLAFGWLKEKTGSITASALFHALSNTFAIWVAWNY